MARTQRPAETHAVRVRVWDLPTRLFHWALAVCTLGACVSARASGDPALHLHFLSGYATLTLVGFRVLWGFAGTHYARFRQFLRGPSATVHYGLSLLRGRSTPEANNAGHNPLGALSILALLAVCLALGASGLFATDYVASEGPLARYVSEKSVDRLSRLHAWGEEFFYALVALHLGAIAFYRFARSENLVGPMLRGDKLLPASPEQRNTGCFAPTKAQAPAATRTLPCGEAAADAVQVNLRALLLFCLCAALVSYLVAL